MFGRLLAKVRPSNAGGHIPADVQSVIDNISVHVRENSDPESSGRVLIFGLYGSPIAANDEAVTRRIESALPDLSERQRGRVVRWVMAEVARRTFNRARGGHDRSNSWVHGWEKGNYGSFDQ